MSGAILFFFFLKKKKRPTIELACSGMQNATKANDELAVVVECFCPCFFGGWPFSFTVPRFQFQFQLGELGGDVQVVSKLQLQKLYEGWV
jgi:hypothetical protein